MSRLPRLRDWSLAVKVPALVASCMIVAGSVASWLVLGVLARTQETHLRQLAATALGSVAATLTPYVERRDVWETYDALDRFVRDPTAPRVMAAVVTLPDGTVLAASDPAVFPTLQPLPRGWWPASARDELVFAEDRSRAFVRRALGGVLASGTIHAELDISELLLQRRHVFWALFLSNAFLTLAMAVGGYALTRRMLRPVAVLTGAVESLREGREPLTPVDDELGSPEFRRLFRRFRVMARAVRERQALLERLIEEERLAQLGRLASATAHEVNNPLAGLLTVVDTLRRRGEDPAIRAAALDLLERGLFHIRNVVQAILVAYKEEDAGRPLTPGAIDDLEVLIRHEVQRKRLELQWHNGLDDAWQTDSGAVRQALLNLLLNACRVSPVGGRVEFRADRMEHALRFTIADSGPGLPAAWRRLLEQPDRAGPPAGRGLGIWTVARLVRKLRGRVHVESRAEGGTRIVLDLPAQPARQLA